MSSTDFAWLNERGAEIVAKYGGQWIGVYDGRVIGVGDTATEAAEQARQAAPGAAFILEAVDAEADGVYACL